MVRSCGVVHCKNNSLKSPLMRFFSIPRILKHQGERDKDITTRRRLAWLAALCRKKEDLTEAKILFTRVCEEHFESGEPCNFRYETDIDWAPTQNLTRLEDLKAKQKVHQAKKRDQRRKERANSQMQNMLQVASASHMSLLEEVSSNICEDQTTAPNEYENVTIPIIGAYQTDPIICLNCNKCPFVRESLIEMVESECQTDDNFLEEVLLTKQENLSLRRELDFILTQAPSEINPLNANALENNDGLVKFYTGFLNFALLKLFFDFCCDFTPAKFTKKGLSRFSEFLLAMIKLRLNVPYKDLAFRFKIDETTASRIFIKWIDAMHQASKHLVVWPEREVRANSMPPSFQLLYGNRIAAIIDCFEIFIVRPSNLKARAQTWSHYKSHNTIKYLISITPQGTVNFISNGWGGRVSDKQITAESGFLKYLKPGDMVMADRGFAIEDLLAPLNCSLAIPSFTRGKSQLTYDDCKKSREIANLRIHVERVIGLLRNRFQILAGAVSIDLLATKSTDDVPLIDKITTVCCALVNYGSSIVSNGQD